MAGWPRREARSLDRAEGRFMNASRSTLLALVPLALLGATAAAQPTPARDWLLPSAEEPLLLAAGRQKIRVVLVTGGLAGPWDIEFLPDGETMLVSESPGRLRIVRNGVLDPEPVWNAPSPAGNDVLHGVVAHPDFAENRLVYAAYTKEREDGLLTLAISRGRLDGGKLTNVREIFVADAWENARNAT